MRNYVLATAAAAALLGVANVSQAEPMTLNTQQLDLITAGANTAGGYTLAEFQAEHAAALGDIDELVAEYISLGAPLSEAQIALLHADVDAMVHTRQQFNAYRKTHGK